jgi:hypothetical protein
MKKHILVILMLMSISSLAHSNDVYITCEQNPSYEEKYYDEKMKRKPRLYAKIYTDGVKIYVDAYGKGRFGEFAITKRGGKDAQGRATIVSGERTYKEGGSEWTQKVTLDRYTASYVSFSRDGHIAKAMSIFCR